MNSTPKSPSPLLERYQNVILIVVGLAVLGGVAGILLGRPEPAVVSIVPPPPTVVPSPTTVPSATPTPGPIRVYATGALVTSDVVVSLPFGSRVGDLVSQLDGPLPNANLEVVNLAAVLNDGDHVHVPTLSVPDVDTGARAVIITPTPGMLTVYITGAVISPRTSLSLSAGSRVEDAVAAVGGPSPDADLDAVNMSQILSDGDMVFIPSLSQQFPPTPTPNHPEWVHINYADSAELERLPGIGPALAESIIEYREANGPFLTVDDLQNVPKIGPATVDGLRDMVVLD